MLKNILLISMLNSLFVGTLYANEINDLRDKLTKNLANSKIELKASKNCIEEAESYQEMEICISVMQKEKKKIYMTQLDEDVRILVQKKKKKEIASKLIEEKRNKELREEKRKIRIAKKNISKEYTKLKLYEERLQEKELLLKEIERKLKTKREKINSDAKKLKIYKEKLDFKKRSLEYQQKNKEEKNI